MMDKSSAENKVCTKCNRDALPGTNPPVCSEHLLDKTASEDDQPTTLKELDAQD